MHVFRGTSMAEFDRQFLDTDGLSTVLNESWGKLQKVLSFHNTGGHTGTNGYNKILIIKCAVQMNKPIVVHILSRGYSSSTAEISFQPQTSEKTPGVQYFVHRIHSFTGNAGKSTNVGYTYEDVDNVRYYTLWKQKNEGYGHISVHVDCIDSYTQLLTIPTNEYSDTEPANIAWATEVWETVPKQTAYTAKGTATKVPQITTNAQGQVTGITEVDITGVPPASHTHGSITNDGKIGTTANLPVITGTGGAVTTGSFSTTASAVGTSSAAGTANTFSRGDHVHSISLATGDSDGQVKIAGSNVDVAGWDKVALSQHQGTKQYHIQVRNTGSNPKGWCPIVRVTKTSGYGSYDAIRVSGTFYYARVNWESDYDFVIDFQAIINISHNTAALYLGKTKMDSVPLRLIRIADRDYELQYNASVANMDYDVYYQVEGNAKSYTTFYTTYQASTSTGTAITSGKRLEGNIAYEADKLSTSRTIRTDLSSTSTASFDGSANITPGVTGTLPIANGGTGKTTTFSARNSLLGDMNEVDTDASDSQRFLMRYATPSDENGAIYYKTGTHVWNWVKDKLTSDTGVNISGNAATATKLGTSDVGSATQPIYLAAGVPTAGTTYAGGTAVTLNNSSKAGSTASFYAPTAGGTANYVLIGNGTTSAPTWAEKAPKATAADSAAKLTTARKTYVTLGSASTSTTRDWSGDTTIPVDGQLKVANGGTGSSTAAGARTNLEVYSKSEVDSMLTGRISVVASLPASGEAGVIYFVGPSGSGADQYEEYIWDGSAFVKVGEKSLDLSNYVNTLSTSGSGSVVTGVSKSGNTLTATLGNIAIENLSDWATSTYVTIDLTTYLTYWPVAPTDSNQVYGLSISNGRLFRIYNNNGTYSVQAYDQDNDTKYTNQSLGQGYGTCKTAEATVAKAVTLSGYELVKGGIVAVKFTYGICADATLKVNSKTAKPIYIKGGVVTAANKGAIAAGDLAYFMYDGTAYHFLGSDRAATNPVTNITRSGTTFTATRLDGSTFTFDQQDNNTTYTQETLGQGYGTCTTAEATAAKVVTLSNYELVKNGVIAVKFTNGLCASATLNVNEKGAKSVFINGAAATATTCKEVQAGDIALFMYDGTQYQFLCTDRVSKSAITGLSVSDTTITYTRADASTGTITTKDTTYTFDGTYNASSNKAATVSTVTNAINALDVSNITGFGAGKTLATLTETDGKIAATFQDISITKSQVSDFSHAHGNITNGGAITADGVALASGDSLVFVDSSDSSLVKKTSITFDGSTTNSMLSKKGEWSDTIAKARAVVDYGATSKAIEIGWSGAAVTSPAYFAVYTDSANGYNKAIKDCSLANVKKAINGTSKGSNIQPTYIDANGVPTAINYTIESNVPSGAVFTDTKQNITLATTTKAFITGVSTTPTSTAQALTGLADTGVYLTTTAGELNATQYKVNEHCTMKYNSTKSSLDFTFS